jgi:hypothetical protein
MFRLSLLFDDGPTRLLHFSPNLAFGRCQIRLSWFSLNPTNLLDAKAECIGGCRGGVRDRNSRCAG